MLHTLRIAEDSQLHTVHSQHFISHTDLSTNSTAHYLRFQYRLVKFERLIPLMNYENVIRYNGALIVKTLENCHGNEMAYELI
jgi:hypothetical protein